jgi:hypothetical protein
MTAAQVSAALAPFYFAVHPDLFSKYPKERVSAGNPVSLEKETGTLFLAQLLTVVLLFNSGKKKKNSW